MTQYSQWTASGKTTAFLFGRFQPLSVGQVSLIHEIQKYGLDLHALTNEKEDTDAERNPYTRAEREAMFKIGLPGMDSHHLHYTTSYIDRGGDVFGAIQQISSVFSAVAPLDRIVIFYVVKKEDEKNYLYNGATTPTLHYVDLFLPPYASCSKQVICPQDIQPVANANTVRLQQYLDSIKTTALARIPLPVKPQVDKRGSEVKPRL